jgi:hypothetical protein
MHARVEPLHACFLLALPSRAQPKKNKKQKNNKKIIKKTKMCVCINKKNKYEFVIFIH